MCFMSASLEETLFDLLAKLEPGASLNPNQVAQAYCADKTPEAWRRELPKLRNISLGLARQDRIYILRKGKPITPETLKGVYRLRAKTSS
jgi:hypothetical protein